MFLKREYFAMSEANSATIVTLEKRRIPSISLSALPSILTPKRHAIFPRVLAIAVEVEKGHVWYKGWNDQLIHRYKAEGFVDESFLANFEGRFKRISREYS